METNEQPISAVKLAAGRGDWRLVIPGAGLKGEDVEFYISGGVSGSSPGVMANLEGLALCLNRYARRIIGDRDEYNAEVGKLKGQIEHLNWVLMTQEMEAMDVRSAMRREMLIKLAKLNGELFADLEQLKRDLADARAETEQAKKAAFDEIKRRQTAELARNAMVTLFADEFKRQREFIDDMEKRFLARTSPPEQRRHSVIVGGNTNEAIGCTFDKVDVLEEEPEAWFIDLPSAQCPMSNHEDGGAESDSDDGLLTLLRWLGREFPVQVFQSWSGARRSMIQRAAISTYLQRYDGAERLKKLDLMEAIGA